MVDVDVGAGGESGRRKMDALGDSAVEIVPLELYDSARAKIAANLQWICAKAYGIGEVAAAGRHAGFCSAFGSSTPLPGVVKFSRNRLCLRRR